MRRPFLHGFFGAPNFGDELLCRSLVDYFGSEGAFIATRGAEVTRRTARGTKAQAIPGMLNQLSFYAWLPWRLWNLRRASHLFIGGGGLINDTYSLITIMRSTFDAASAVSLGTPYTIVGIELGSVYHQPSQERARFLLRNAQAVWCRDPGSAERARQLIGQDDARVFEMPDLAHAFLRDWYRAHPRPAGRGSHCVINPLQIHNVNARDFAALLTTLCERFEKVTLVSAQPGEERAWLSTLASRPTNLEVFACGDWEPPLELLRSADLLIAQRFHYIAAGAHAGVPMVPIIATGKARHLVEQFGLAEHALDNDDFSLGKVLALIDTARPVPEALLDRITQNSEDCLAQVRRQAGQPKPYCAAQRAEARKLAWATLTASVVDKLSGIQKKVRRILAPIPFFRTSTSVLTLLAALPYASDDLMDYLTQIAPTFFG